MPLRFLLRKSADVAHAPPRRLLGTYMGRGGVGLNLTLARSC
jgi:hypothetical protein